MQHSDRLILSLQITMTTKIINKLIGTIWAILCRREYRNFFQYTQNVRKTQEDLLISLIRKNQDSAFGKDHHFKNINTVQDFTNKVCPGTYEDYQPYVDRIARGEKHVLTIESTLMFEKTSGSTSASKFVPYTATFKTEYQKGLKVWIYDMYKHTRGIFNGKSYWSISPILKTDKKTPGGIPIGYEEDGEYLGRLEKWIFNRLHAVPAEIKYIQDISSFRYITLLYLLKEKNLSFISVWNPTFLLLILDQFLNWKDNLLKDLEHGTITIQDKSIINGHHAILEKKLGKNRKRANELRRILEQNPKRFPFVDCWPNLKLISCWDSSFAAMFIDKIKGYFPGIPVQGKGLLATEGNISIPLFGYYGNALCISSHFFEFQEAEAPNKIKMSDQLELGKTYSILLTTGGGFYRYRLLDLVKVVGFLNQCPLIQFRGKEEKVSDYFGEKLNENFVDNILQHLFGKYKIEPSFFMVAPDWNNNDELSYTLFLEPNKTIKPSTLKQIQMEIENQLRENTHYHYCRHLNQLNSFKIYLIDCQKGNKTYTDTCCQLGQKLGDIKPVVLHTKTGWSERFPGIYL